MEKTLFLLGFNFYSDSVRTPQYLEFHRTFKREFKALLKGKVKRIEVIKPNHFDVSGFFELNDNRIYYFDISDLRYSKKEMLIRTAKDFKDYTGGANNFIKLDNDFMQNFFNYLVVSQWET